MLIIRKVDDMSKIFEKGKIRNSEIKNKLVLPPMVTFSFSQNDGYVTDKKIFHYKTIADNGIGIVMVEATSVSEYGKLSVDQLGIWDDKYIDGLSNLAKAIKDSGAKAFIQIHHAGLRTKKEVNDSPITSSDYKDERSNGREMTIEEINTVVQEFIQGAIRAQKAGFDGIELHGAHSYLLTQFFSEKVNKRTDTYGGSFENRNRIALEIYEGIRKNTNEDFIVGIRIGTNENSLEESIERAKVFEKVGFDFLNVSTGFDNTKLDIHIPDEFPCNWIVFGATKIKENVSIPVIGVNMIKEKHQIDYLLDNNLLDFVAIGRGQLADYEFTKHLENGEEILTCLECKPCKWYKNGEQCPRQIQIGRYK